MATRKYTSISYKEYPVADGNYDESRKPIDLIVLHHTACTYTQAIAHFASPTAGTSAHYIVSNKGELAAMLEEYYTAYHSGNYAVNQRSIAIETEWYESMGGRTDALYETVAKLIADICKFYGLPVNTDTIQPHKSFVATQCPGTLDIPRIIARAREINQLPIESNSMTEQQKKDIESMQNLRKYRGTWYESRDVIRDWELLEAEKREAGRAWDVETAKLKQDIANEKEAVSRLEKRLLDEAKGYRAQIEALEAILTEKEKGNATLQDTIRTLQKQVDFEAKEKGKALSQLAECQAGNKPLSVAELLVRIFNKLKGVSL